VCSPLEEGSRLFRCNGYSGTTRGLAPLQLSSYQRPCGLDPSSLTGSVISKERIAASPCGGLSPPRSTTLDTTPQPHTVGFPCDSTPPPACLLFHSDAKVPALFRVRVSPSVPQELYAIHRRFPRQERLGPPKFFDASLPACHGLRTPADLPLLAMSEGSCSLRERSNPRRPQSPCRSCTSTSGDAAPPAAYRILCLRFVHLVRQGRDPDSAMDARLDTGGWLALTRQGLSPCKRRQAFLARQRCASAAGNSGSEGRADAVPSRLQAVDTY
jgi:hypothetical protein